MFRLNPLRLNSFPFAPAGLAWLLFVSAGCGPNYGLIKQGMAGKRTAAVYWAPEKLQVSYDESGRSVRDYLKRQKQSVGNSLDGAMGGVIQTLQRSFREQKFSKGGPLSSDLHFRFEVNGYYEEKGSSVNVPASATTPAKTRHGQPPFRYVLHIQARMSIIDSARKKLLGQDKVAEIRSAPTAAFPEHQELNRLLKVLPPGSMASRLKSEMQNNIAAFARRVESAKVEPKN